MYINSKTFYTVTWRLIGDGCAENLTLSVFCEKQIANNLPVALYPIFTRLLNVYGYFDTWIIFYDPVA